MKRLFLVTMVAVLGFMFLMPSFGFCDNAWRHNDRHARYVVVCDRDPRDYHPQPVRHVYHQRNVYVERRHDDDRGGQVAVAALGGIVVGTLLGTVIAQGR
jgi:hypothetical protein